ncbi:MAG TPA: glycine zipper 2TM domain-containing protein [Woeseiaceae bacterium]|jgi:uncharacterized protein YcfJ|nr:glycine zipper 2TM domain-containing protein [Woeseiaceae bacterium]
MNGKRALAGLAAAAMLLGFSSNASADHSGGRAVYDYAHVVSARPIVRYVTVRMPVQQCWEDTEYYATRHAAPGVAGGTLVGAIIGGVVGHQFGSGSGNDAATIAGSLIGAAIGNDAARRRTGDAYTTVEHATPVRRCETRYRAHREERIDGYEVVYRYRGQTYATRMPYDPGKRLKVRVDIRPAR